MPRPDSLLEFSDPPLNETALSVQFVQPRGYHQIMAGEVWNLFRKEFPRVQEVTPLAPAFETFGTHQGPAMNFGFINGPTHNRFWFLSPSEDRLLQFQHDRFVHNWRRLPGSTTPYPRFDKILPSYAEKLYQLENYFASIEPQDISINQVEITYINHIRGPTSKELDPDLWLRIIKLEDAPIEGFSISFQRPILRSDGSPQGRVHCEATSAYDQDGQPLIILTLIARGAPDGTSVKDALEFLEKSRETLVTLFAEVTTEAAQKVWGRER